MSRAAHRLFSSSARLGSSAAARSTRAAVTRRMMSSESHASHGSASSDRPWIIGSALVFGPLFLYLVSPSARKDHGHADHSHGSSHRDEHQDKHVQHVESQPPEAVAPIADDEGTRVSHQEVKESVEKALEADSPKDAQEREEVVAEAETTTAEASPAIETHSEVVNATPASEPEPNVTPASPVDVATQATAEESTTVPGPAGESKG